MGAPSPADVLAEAQRSLDSCGRVALCQITATRASTPGKPGWKLLVRPDGETFGNLGGGSFEAMVVADARELLGRVRPEVETKRYYLTERAERGEATGMVCGGLADVTLEVLEAPPLLLVCGGGTVGQALCAAAELAGLATAVTDDRSEYLSEELFPTSTARVPAGPLFRDLDLGRWGERRLLVAVVSRCWETDLEALAAVASRRPGGLEYVGLMGSARKIERVRAELAERGLDLAALPLHAPIGLDLGAETPGELAIAILAEMMPVWRRLATDVERRAGSVAR
ncbi:MAG: XdhC/CoxI family protein [Thermoanaerobaculia bacterium]